MAMNRISINFPSVGKIKRQYNSITFVTPNAFVHRMKYKCTYPFCKGVRPSSIWVRPLMYTSQVCSIRSVSSFLGMQGSRNPKTRLLPNSVYYILLFFNWNSFRCAHLVGIDSPSSGTNSQWAQNQYGLLALRIRVKNWEIVRHLRLQELCGWLQSNPATAIARDHQVKFLTARGQSIWRVCRRVTKP